MPRASRAFAGGLCYHVVNRGNARQRVFHKPEDFAAFARLPGEAKQIMVPPKMPRHSLFMGSVTYPQPWQIPVSSALVTENGSVEKRGQAPPSDLTSRSFCLHVGASPRFSTGRKLPIVLVVLGFLAAVVEPDWGQAGVAADDPPGQSEQIDLKLVELRKAVKAAASPERTRSLISEAFSLIDDSLAADEYTAAIRTAALAVEAAETLGNEHVSAVCATRKDEVSNIAKEAKKLSKQMEKLRKHPNDKAANFDVGHFRCIVRGDWERGLPLLARGSNSNWGAAARKDLDSPVDADGQIAAGSDWAGLIVGEKGAGKRALALRAAHWYRKALKQAAGDSRTKAAAAMESLPICYLTDMDEFDVKAGPWPMGKHGDVGAGRPIEVNGFKFPLGIGLHPPDNAEAVIKYRLNGRYKTLVTGAAINDLVDGEKRGRSSLIDF